MCIPRTIFLTLTLILTRISTLQGFGVYPCLSFSRSPVELPVVPLSVTSRAVFFVTNAGFSDMEVSYRLPQHCPVELAVAFPEGRQVKNGANVSVLGATN